MCEAAQCVRAGQDVFARQAELIEEGDFVHMRLARKVDLEKVLPATRDFTVGIITRMCRLTLGEFIAPVKVEMERPRPVDPARWEYVLSTRVEFDCPTTRITWSRADIMEPLATGDPVLARINDEQTEA